ncbi:MAG TPA: ectonucleotide pyrophosphatase/phosphodiesterase [Verrucomicrobiae bacterium]|nr:ectonucleotide pyrophosphatase/phosphodiesterase [Verrucomicrobiae bacterium]
MISVDGLAGYYLDDPKAEMPAIRALAAGGARAQSMKPSTPTVTWPNHTTLVTGVNPARHGVVGNNYYDRATGKKVRLIFDPVYDKDVIVKVPTLYDLAKEHGLKTAGIRWPASRNAKTLDWTMPDMTWGKEMLDDSTPALLDECKRAHIALPAVTKSKHSSHVVPSDATATRIFNMILHDHRPNLALLHLIEVDHTEHRNGPRSPEAYAAVASADARVGEVWDELKRDFPGRATLFVVSDHGFSPVSRTLLPNVLFRKAGLANSVQVVAQAGAAMIYVTDTPRRADIISRMKSALTGLDGLDRVVTSDQFASLGMATPDQDPHAPDLLLLAKEGCVFGDTADGDLPIGQKPESKGSHGHDSSLPDLQATFVAWGAGIKPKVNLGKISNTDVAPTIAPLLGFSLPQSDGMPLKDALLKGSDSTTRASGEAAH